MNLFLKIKTVRFLTIWILLCIIFLNPAFVNACEPPVEFLKLNTDLQLEITQFKKKISSPLNKNSKLFLEQKWSEKMTVFRNDVKKNFPAQFRKIFDDYEINIETIDALFEAVRYNDNSLSESEREELQYLSYFHIYMLSKILPDIMSFRKYQGFTDSGFASEEIITQALDLKESLAMELTSSNLKLCKDQEGIEERGLKTTETLIEDVSGAGETLTEKAIGVSQDLFSTDLLSLQDASQDLAKLPFDGNKETPGDSSKADYEGDEKENPDMNPRSEEIKGSKFIGWIKDFLSIFSTKKTSQKKTSSEIYSKDLSFIGAHQKNLNITDRHLSWQNDRNFWVNRTREISGKKTDFFIQTFEEIVNTIEQTNEELDKSIADIATICKNQNYPIKCWE